MCVQTQSENLRFLFLLLTIDFFFNNMPTFIRQTWAWPSYKISCHHTVAMSASVYKPWGPGARGTEMEGLYMWCISRLGTKKGSSNNEPGTSNQTQRPTEQTFMSKCTWRSISDRTLPRSSYCLFSFSCLWLVSIIKDKCRNDVWIHAYCVYVSVRIKKTEERSKWDSRWIWVCVGGLVKQERTAMKVLRCKLKSTVKGRRSSLNENTILRNEEKKTGRGEEKTVSRGDPLRGWARARLLPATKQVFHTEKHPCVGRLAS